MRKIIIDKSNENQRIDKFLKRYMPNAAGAFIYRMLREKKIKLNDQKTSGNVILRAGDEIKIYFSDSTLEIFTNQKCQTANDVRALQKIELRLFEKNIIARSDDILLINKPAGMLSQKAKKSDISVCELLIEYLKSKNETDDEKLLTYRPSVVNRLDRNTSGVLICALTLKGAQCISEIIKQRTIKKEYLCLVIGKAEKEMTVEGYLVKDAGSNKVRIISQKEAVSVKHERIKTLFRPVIYEKGLTLVSVELITGKTHQIRSQMAALGYPLAGDPKYGDAGFNAKLKREYGLNRQFLHSYRLQMPTDERLGEIFSGKTFTAPLPSELTKVLKNALPKDIQTD